MLGRRRVHIEAIVLDRHFLRLIAETAKFSVKIVPHGSFIAGDGLDVDSCRVSVTASMEERIAE